MHNVGQLKSSAATTVLQMDGHLIMQWNKQVNCELSVSL